VGDGVARGEGAGESQGPVEEIEVCALADDVVTLGWGEVSRIHIPTGEAHKDFYDLWGGGAIRARP
jgi:hypothetical protein